MSGSDVPSVLPSGPLWRDPLFLLPVFVGAVLRWFVALQRPGLLLEDADGYLAHAETLLRLGRYAGPYTGVSTAFRPPGFVLLLAVPLWLGLRASTAVLVVQLILSLCCSWSTAALAVLAGLPRAMVLLAVVGVSFDPLLVLYSVQPMSEVPCAAVLSMALVCYLWSGVVDGVTDGVEKPGAGVRWNVLLTAAFAGLLFAAGGLIRPAVLLAAAMCLAAGVVSCVRAVWRGGGRGGGWLRMGLVSVAGCGFGVGLFPWVLRNAVVFGTFIPATTHGGYTLALGNNPDFYRDVIHQPTGNEGNGYPWRGDRLELWQRRTLREAELSGVRPGDEPALDRWYYACAESSIRGDWSAFVGACVLRVTRFWAITGSGGSGSAVQWLTGLWYGFWWCGLAAGLGSRRRPSEVLMWLCVLVFCGLHVVYWTDTRMRAPVMPFLIVLSSGGLWRGYQRTRVRGRSSGSANALSAIWSQMA
ncbi:MAG: hypothetical protein ACKO2P_20745 [Planctomycetota bacterium]